MLSRDSKWTQAAIDIGVFMMLTMLFYGAYLCGKAYAAMDERMNGIISAKCDAEEELFEHRELMLSIWGDEFDIGKIKTATVEATSYNPLREQCDADPLIASDNRLVTPGVLAMPKKYRQELGIELGQRVALAGYGMFTVRDHMNSRFHARVDIISFIPKWSKHFGIKQNIKLIWVDNG
jgi:3D (Asp-Asp-Asp) domain-containing protein